MLDSLPELIVIFCGMPIGAIVAGYIGFLAWFRIDDFKGMVNKRINSRGWLLGTGLIEAWMSTQFYIWFIRGITLLGFGFCVVVLIASLVAMLLR